jgi:hypothetical protein
VLVTVGTGEEVDGAGAGAVVGGARLGVGDGAADCVVGGAAGWAAGWAVCGIADCVAPGEVALGELAVRRGFTGWCFGAGAGA